MRLSGNLRHTGGRRGGLSPLAIIIICVVSAIVLTVIVGLILKNSLDEDAYNRLTAGTAPKEEPTNQNPSYLRDIHADAYVLGEEMESVWEVFSEVSVTLNTPVGFMNYTSEVVSYLGMESTTDRPLYDDMSELAVYSTYVSGVFYPQALAYESGDMQYAAAAKECAVMKEFLHAGGSEILLCGIPFNQIDTASVLRYVKQVKAMAGEAPVGVAVPFAVARAEGAWTLLESLAQECDFLALDLTEVTSPGGAEQILTDARYYIQQYDMRVLLNERQEDLILAAYTYPDVQIITYYPPINPPTPDQPIQ